MQNSIVTETAFVAAQEQSTLQRRVLREQVRLIYKQGPTLSLGAALAAGCITFLASQSGATEVHILWLSVVLFSALIRFLLFNAYASRMNVSTSRPDNKSGDIVDVSFWGVGFAAGSALSGLVWAVWPVLFYADCSTEYLLMISALFAGMVAVLASSGSVYLPAFYFFAVPLCFPLAYHHVVSGVDVLIWTGWLLVMFFFVNLALALRGNRHYAELIEARFRNSDLMTQLAAEKQLAETAVSEKNSFIAAASHDLRQPLHALSLFVSSLQRSELSSRQQETVVDMQKSCSALNDHFNSILDVSRLESDSVPVAWSNESISSLLLFLESDFRADSDQKSLGLHIDLPPESLFVYTDRLLLERVLRNIVGNAIRYTQTGGITVTVRAPQATPTEEPGQGTTKRVIVRVSDTGRGVSPAQQPLIFNDYHRGDAGAGAGIGLGLAIVKRLSKLLNISIEFESSPGEGSVFNLGIPAAANTTAYAEFGLVSKAVPMAIPLEKTMAVAHSHGEEAEIPGLQNRLILVIDDEPVILAASRSILTSFGARTIVALSLPQAIEELAVSGQKPDAILCDYRLPGEMNGIEVVAQLRDFFSESDQENLLPACIITGDTSPDRLRVVSASGLPVLYKPLSAEQLQKQLLALLVPEKWSEKLSN